VCQFEHEVKPIKSLARAIILMMKGRVKMKRILSILLVMTMIFGLMTTTTLAATNDLDASIEKFVTEVESMTYREEFAKALLLVKDLDDVDGFKTAMTAMYGALGGAQVDRLEEFGASLDASKDFADFVMTDDFNKTNLLSYLGVDDGVMSASDTAAFKAAIMKRKDVFKTKVLDGNDENAIFAGFSRMDTLFGYLVDASSKNIEFINELSNDDLELDRSVATVLIKLGSDKLKNGIDGVDEVLDALEVLVKYYNDASSADQELMFTYLDGYNFIDEYTSGGGSSGGSSTPSDPDPKDETSDEDSTIQKDVDDAGKTEVDATVETDESGKKVAKSTVTTNAVREAVKNMVEKIAELQKTTDTQLPKRLVFEVKKESSADKVKFELPLAALKELKADGSMDSVKIKTQFGDVEFDPNNVDESGDGQLEVTIEKVSGEDLPNSLSGEFVLEYSINYVKDGESKSVNKFRRPIVLSVNESAMGDVDFTDRSLSAFYWNPETGESEPLGGSYNGFDAFEFGTTHLSQYYVKKSVVDFSDVNSSYWAYTYIRNFAGKGLINGVSEESFEPLRDITRAEFVAIIARMYMITGDTSKLPFDDVDEDAWYAEDVAAAYEAGYITGKTTTTFEPNAKITRQEAAKVISNVLMNNGHGIIMNTADIQVEFSDYSSIGSWAVEAVATVFKEGIVSGKPDNKFDPQGNATRAEVVKMLTELYFID